MIKDELARACTCHPSEASQPCEQKYAFSECQASASFRAGVEAAAQIVEAQAEAAEINRFIVNGDVLKDQHGNTKFISTVEVDKLLRERAAAIRALEPTP